MITAHSVFPAFKVQFKKNFIYSKKDLHNKVKKEIRKNKEEMEGILEREFQNFRFARVTLERKVQASIHHTT